MSRPKSIFVTVLVALMLAMILTGMVMLKIKAYMVIVGILAVYGYICGCYAFCHWMQRADLEFDNNPILPPIQDFEPDEKWVADYETIKAELEKD
ncbi:MAG: hypothetical protein KBT02_07310 [Treponema sp.]|nr:hypothetical protein [Candidatus Treponema caballi]